MGGTQDPQYHWPDLLDAATRGEWVDWWPKGPVMESLHLPAGVTSWERGVARGKWPIDRSFFHSAGALFGGFLGVLADLATTWAMFSVLEDAEFFNTSDLRISFFRPVTEGMVLFEARVVHRGRRIAFVEASFSDASERLLAKAAATEVIIPMPDREVTRANS